MPDTDVLHSPAPDVRNREKLEGGIRFRMATEFEPAGDQPTAIKELSAGVLDGDGLRTVGRAQPHIIWSMGACRSLWAT